MLTIKHMQTQIIECAEYVYLCLGTGHSESVYHKAMEVELRTKGIMYETKVIIPVLHRGLVVGYSEADLIVYDIEKEETIGYIVELKAVTYSPRELEKAQLNCYLRSKPDINHGLLINFRQPSTTNPTPGSVDCLCVTKDSGWRGRQESGELYHLGCGGNETGDGLLIERDCSTTSDIGIESMFATHPEEESNSNDSE